MQGQSVASWWKAAVKKILAQESNSRQQSNHTVGARLHAVKQSGDLLGLFPMKKIAYSA